jgi:putative AlgH/UPF0301 family transcriptional regulator
MATVVQANRNDFAAVLLGAAMLWLSQAAAAQPGELVTVLVANGGLNDAAYRHAAVVLQPGTREEIGVIINRPSAQPRANVVAALVIWRPGELADELRRGLWLKREVPLDTVLRRDSGDALWEEPVLT